MEGDDGGMVTAAASADAQNVLQWQGPIEWRKLQEWAPNGSLSSDLTEYYDSKYFCLFIIYFCCKSGLSLFSVSCYLHSPSSFFFFFLNHEGC